MSDPISDVRLMALVEKHGQLVTVCTSLLMSRSLTAHVIV